MQNLEMIGERKPRAEDEAILRGTAQYTDDHAPDGMVYAAFFRSPFASGTIRDLNTTEARKAPGVLMVLTATDLEDHGYSAIPCNLPLKSADGSAMIVPDHHSLAKDQVFYCGQPVAMIVAQTMAQALDAKELIDFDVSDGEATAQLERWGEFKEQEGLVHKDVPDNQVLDYTFGDWDAVAAEFDKAHHITRLQLVNNRICAVPLEPRGCVAQYLDGRYHVTTGCQGVFGLRQALSNVLGVDREKVRVIAKQVGGSFGMKASVYPEHLPVLHAARELDKPVKWINDRSESFLTDYHGRSSVFDAAIALDQEGRFLALSYKANAEIGAFAAAFGPGIATMVVKSNMAGPYRFKALGIRTKKYLTSTTPLTAFRGAGRPEAVFMLDRLIEEAAHEMGMDPIELRRKNLISQEELPYKAANGQLYDSGAFQSALDRALSIRTGAERSQRRKDVEARGKLYGMGLTTYLEVTAGGGQEMGGLSFDEDGKITFTTGTLDYGQGHKTAFSQVLSEKLGVPQGQFELMQGDSDALITGGGTGGSRSLLASGHAALDAADEAIKKGLELASQHLEAAAHDIDFAQGQFTVKGTDQSVSLSKLAQHYPGRLDTSLKSDMPPSTYPNGCHISEVEVDPDTGAVKVLSYLAVDDFGRIINPMIVEGQVQGGIAQAMGQVLCERVVYDEQGQLLTGSFMDYALVRADMLPPIQNEFAGTLAQTNRLGVKGCGEAGISSSMPCLANAVLNALRPLGVKNLNMPFTSEKIWRAIDDARKGQE